MNYYIKYTIISITIFLFIILLYFVINIINIYLNSKKSIQYTAKNNIFCSKNNCDVNISEIPYPKEININNWSLEIAKYCLENVFRFEKSVYNNTKQIFLKNIKLLDNIYINKKEKIFGVILEDNINNNIWVCFRGTQTLSEIISDLKTKQIKSSIFKNCLIHEGFEKIYSVIRKNIMDTVKKNIMDKNKNIIVTGHSLGASIATLTGLELSINGYNSVVYNFASPRIGNEEFKKMVNNNVNVFRIVNQSDIVPTLPSSVFPNFENYKNPFIYNHCGILKSFDDNWFSSLNNHLLPVYVKNIDNIDK